MNTFNCKVFELSYNVHVEVMTVAPYFNIQVAAGNIIKELLVKLIVILPF